MNLHEYQAKQLLAQHGVKLPSGEVCDTPEAARAIAQKLIEQGAQVFAVKSQIHSGGRGKGVFKDGFRGGVKICRTAEEAYATAKAMLNNVLVTKQTGSEGRSVRKLLLEEALDIRKEFYLAVLLDRRVGKPVMMASTEGGMDIEEVAERSPEKIIKEIVDPALGLMPYQARKVAVALGLRDHFISEAAKLITGVYQTWWNSDASLVEINPLCIISHNGKESIAALDAKIAIEDNALYRQPKLQAMRDLGEEAPLEIEAGKHNLNYIKLDGTIACLVNGAGLAMATMDIIQHFGANPANFLDVGGGASKDQVTAAFGIILRDPNVKAILVNIFGGIMDCNVIAAGIVEAVRDTGLQLPLIVRLEGNNSKEGNATLAASGLKLVSATSMADAARKAVETLNQKQS